MWLHVPIITALTGQRQEDHKFKAGWVDYTGFLSWLGAEGHHSYFLFIPQ
jgi:hypothetical protein